jgi:hydrogenase maturation protease
MGRRGGQPVDESGVKTLLLGMGNPIVTDDAVGIMLARDVGAALGPRPDVDVIDECSIGGLNLLDLVAGYDRLIALDSIKTRDGVPGTWYRFDATDLRETMNLRNVHDANFATAMELGRSVGMRVPDAADMLIFAVEIDDNINFGEGLSPLLDAAYDELRDEILAEVRRVLEGQTQGGGAAEAGACGGGAPATEAAHDEADTIRSTAWR